MNHKNIFTIQNAASPVPDTTKIFGGSTKVTVEKVPGFPEEKYVRWGEDDQLPYKLTDAVAKDEVSAQNKMFNVLTCYGAGLQFTDRKTEKETTDENIQRWIFNNGMPSFFLNQCTDMKYFFFSVAVIILSADGYQINRLVHKDACYCRFQEADENGKINHIYYGDFREGLPKTVERLTLLDANNTLDELERLAEETKERKFAILMRFPTAGCQYYPDPYWTAVLRGGSYDEKRLINAAKLAKLRNYTSIRYQVEVSDSYWKNICDEENITDPDEMAKRIDEEKEHIKEYCTSAENADTVWISRHYVNPDGKEVHDVIINRIDNGKEGDDWAGDTQAAANTICYADNIHPSLVGAVPGKSQQNNSGSDKRELFTMKQALEISFHDILLQPLQLVCLFNKWYSVKPTVPFIQLTTLDEHRDAKKVAQTE